MGVFRGYLAASEADRCWTRAARQWGDLGYPDDTGAALARAPIRNRRAGWRLAVFHSFAGSHGSGPFVLPMGLRLGIPVGKTCPARGPRDPGAEGCFADILAC